MLAHAGCGIDILQAQRQGLHLFRPGSHLDAEGLSVEQSRHSKGHPGREQCSLCGFVAVDQGLALLNHEQSICVPLKVYDGLPRLPGLRLEPSRHGVLGRRRQACQKGNSTKHLGSSDDAHLFDLLLSNDRHDVLPAQRESHHVCCCTHGGSPRHVEDHGQLPKECSLLELAQHDLLTIDRLEGIANATLDDVEHVANLALCHDVAARGEIPRLELADKHILLIL
mmetsp:Transcript_15661/g.27820  ORF Transcript_15661/g.27820 Transcript_15661/m.27820 type:complete len:225 (+) Transcript_15661:481-1155(+)